jgi:AhpD family alkylhydroperoxidase
LSGKLIFFFTRRQFARLTGRQPENMIEPLELYARRPALMRAYGRLEQATSKLHGLDWRLQVLAELKASTVVQCEFCIDLASQIARHSGLSDDELMALSHYRDSDLFSELDRLVMDYAVGMSRTPAHVSDEVVAELRRHLNDGEILELTHHIAIENLRSRLNVGLGVGAAGFSAGSICALPVTIDWQVH